MTNPEEEETKEPAAGQSSATENDEEIVTAVQITKV